MRNNKRASRSQSSIWLKLNAKNCFGANDIKLGSSKCEHKMWFLFRMGFLWSLMSFDQITWMIITFEITFIFGFPFRKGRITNHGQMFYILFLVHPMLFFVCVASSLNTNTNAHNITSHDILLLRFCYCSRFFGCLCLCHTQEAVKAALDYKAWFINCLRFDIQHTWAAMAIDEHLKWLGISCKYK